MTLLERVVGQADLDFLEPFTTPRLKQFLASSGTIEIAPSLKEYQREGTTESGLSYRIREFEAYKSDPTEGGNPKVELIVEFQGKMYISDLQFDFDSSRTEDEQILLLIKKLQEANQLGKGTVTQNSAQNRETHAKIISCDIPYRIVQYDPETRRMQYDDDPLESTASEYETVATILSHAYHINAPEMWKSETEYLQGIEEIVLNPTSVLNISLDDFNFSVQN